MQVQIPSPYPLPSTHPASDCQEEVPLTICFPSNKLPFVTLSGSLFIQTPRVVQRYTRLSTIACDNTSKSDFMSHHNVDYGLGNLANKPQNPGSKVISAAQI